MSIFSISRCCTFARLLESSIFLFGVAIASTPVAIESKPFASGSYSGGIFVHSPIAIFIYVSRPLAASHSFSSTRFLLPSFHIIGLGCCFFISLVLSWFPSGIFSWNQISFKAVTTSSCKTQAQWVLLRLWVSSNFRVRIFYKKSTYFNHPFYAPNLTDAIIRKSYIISHHEG